MGATTGPAIALGAITLGNSMLLNGKPFDPKIPVATVIVTGMFALAERGWPRAATALAWTALAAVCLTRIDPNVPSPAESLARVWQGL